MIGLRGMESCSRMHSLVGAEGAFGIGKAELVVEMKVRL